MKDLDASRLSAAQVTSYLMRPIKLPELPGGLSLTAKLEISEGGVCGAVRRVVVIVNGFSSAESQCIGLVRALGLSGRYSLYRVTRPRGGLNEWLHWLRVSVHQKFDYLTKRICGSSRFRLVAPQTTSCKLVTPRLSQVLEADAKLIARMAHQTFEKDGPLLMVASGRDTISVASSIKRLAADNVFVIQEQIPWFLWKWITPRDPPDKRVVLTVGALHQADSAALRGAASAWHDELAPLPRPFLVVNVGGVLWSCGSIRISFSRRNSNEGCQDYSEEFSNNPKVYIWDGQDPNPHMGHLAWTDAFVVTADSVSMLSEACSTGKPVYVIGAGCFTWKFADFQKSLLERGVVRPFTSKEDMSENWSYSPLNDLAEAASQVNLALAERGWRIHA